LTPPSALLLYFALWLRHSLRSACFSSASSWRTFESDDDSTPLVNRLRLFDFTKIVPRLFQIIVRACVSSREKRPRLFVESNRTVECSTDSSRFVTYVTVPFVIVRVAEMRGAIGARIDRSDFKSELSKFAKREVFETHPVYRHAFTVHEIIFPRKTMRLGGKTHFRRKTFDRESRLYYDCTLRHPRLLPT